MPITSIDCSKTIIYKIVCNDLKVTDLYVGSTTDIIRRKHRHKYNCNNSKQSNHHLKIYQTIRANGGWDNWSVVLVEEYPCANKLEARRRERYWLETLDASMNMKIPTRGSYDKVCCPVCGMRMNQKSMLRHTRNKHP